MANFAGPPTWASVSTYTANQSMVAGSVGYTGFYFLCTTSGISGSSAPTWASVFGTTVTDGTAAWICAQRQRSAWVSKSQYTAGLPIITTSTVTHSSASLTAVAGGTQFVPVGTYFIINQGGSQPSPPAYGTATISAITAASTAVMSTTAGGTSAATETTIFITPTLPYPLADQLIIATGGSPTYLLAQCVVSGTSGSVQPTWPSTLVQVNGQYSFTVVDDTGSLQWSSVGFDPTGAASVWTANHTYQVGQICYANLYDWVCTVSGTTGNSASQPAWTIVGDGSALWAIVAASP